MNVALFVYPRIKLVGIVVVQIDFVRVAVDVRLQV